MSVGCCPLADTCNLAATSLCPKESFTIQESVVKGRNQSCKRCWVLPGIHTHNPQQCLLVFYISQMLYTTFHLSALNHQLCVWKWLFSFGRPVFTVFCLQVQMCEPVQGRGSSVLEGLAVKMLAKLFFYVNVAAAASDGYLLQYGTLTHGAQCSRLFPYCLKGGVTEKGYFKCLKLEKKRTVALFTSCKVWDQELFVA